jgi:hypothetical protein
MAKFRQMSPKYWQDPKVRRWPDHQKLLGAYLLTSPHRTSEGLFWLPHGYVAQDLGWSIERVSEGYSGLAEAGFCAYDDTSETVLLYKALKYEAPVGEKQMAGAIARLADMPPSPLFALLRDAAEQYAPAFGKALDAAVASGALAHHQYPSDTPPEGDPRGIPSRARDRTNSNSNPIPEASPPAPSRASRSGRASTALVVVADPTPEPNPPDPLEPPETAQTVLAAYIDWRHEQGINGFDPRTKGQLAKHLRGAFDAGHPPDAIKLGLLNWHYGEQHPATLPSFIDAAARGGGNRASPTKAARQMHATDQALQRWAEEVDADGQTRVAQDRRQAQRIMARPADQP